MYGAAHAQYVSSASTLLSVQILFHFRTLKLAVDGSGDGDSTHERVIDDTRVLGTGPFELLIGRDFKLAVWEEMVKTMAVGEVARFTCPFQVSSTLY